MNKIPFVVYASITPDPGTGKRMEIRRSLERIANSIYDDLVNNFTSGNIASPGGGGQWGLAADPYSFSDLVNIVAVKPQFGQSPYMVTIDGFYDVSPAIPCPNISRIMANAVYTGPATGAPGWSSDFEPTSANIDQVKAFKAAIEAAVTSAAMTIIKIEFNGVVYGYGGYHFPR